MKLGFNIDHIATLRNARNEGYPNLITAANLAIKAGAHQITAHLREDRRHIRDQDMFDLKAEIDVDLNMEMASTNEMLNLALKIQPYSACLVPEKREELTTEGGLDIIANSKELKVKINALKAANIKPVLFIDANLEQVKAAIDLEVFGVEFNTGQYANHTGKIQQIELEKIQQMANMVVNNNIEAHAGHGLNYTNVVNIAKILVINELNIGHFLIAEAVIGGLNNSIVTILEIINNARK